MRASDFVEGLCKASWPQIFKNSCPLPLRISLSLFLSGVETAFTGDQCMKTTDNVHPPLLWWMQFLVRMQTEYSLYFPSMAKSFFAWRHKNCISLMHYICGPTHTFMFAQLVCWPYQFVLIRVMRPGWITHGLCTSESWKQAFHSMRYLFRFHQRVHVSLLLRDI